MISENYDDGIKRQFQAQMDLQNGPGSIGFGPARPKGICIVQGNDVVAVYTLECLRAVIRDLTEIAEAWEKTGSPTRPPGWEDET